MYIEGLDLCASCTAPPAWNTTASTTGTSLMVGNLDHQTGYAVYLDKSWTGYTVTRLPVSSLQGCVRIARERRCDYFSFDPISQSCIVKKPQPTQGIVNMVIPRTQVGAGDYAGFSYLTDMDFKDSFDTGKVVFGVTMGECARACFFDTQCVTAAFFGNVCAFKAPVPEPGILSGVIWPRATVVSK
ncbi:hypothetical protein HDU80_009660 [Chytriomyces hyalinus]|nr:hypothetical protein HDU80_009660 [Chytriomyces hyalinus]